MVVFRIGATFLLAGLVAGCPGETAEERAVGSDSLPATGSFYTRDSDSSMMVEGTPTGAMLTAPAIIPAVRLSLTSITSDTAADADNRAAYKTLLADLVASMQTDMNRLRISDHDDLQELGDSLLNEVGGGTGDGEGPDEEELPLHAQRVERLIALYAAKVRSAGALPDTVADSAVVR